MKKNKIVKKISKKLESMMVSHAMDGDIALVNDMLTWKALCDMYAQVIYDEVLGNTGNSSQKRGDGK